MKVVYTGKYREPAVCYRGVSFVKGKASEVTEKWYEDNKGGSVSIEKPKAKAKAKPKAQANDNDND